MAENKANYHHWEIGPFTLALFLPGFTGQSGPVRLDDARSYRQFMKKLYCYNNHVTMQGLSVSRRRRPEYLRYAYKRYV